MQRFGKLGMMAVLVSWMGIELPSQAQIGSSALEPGLGGIARPTDQGVKPAAKPAKSADAMKSESSGMSSQTSPKDKKPLATKSVVGVRQRLPRYYSSLELTAGQRAEILQAQSRYEKRLIALKAQIDTLMEQRSADCQKLLNPDQLSKLTELQGSVAMAVPIAELQSTK